MKVIKDFTYLSKLINDCINYILYTYLQEKWNVFSDPIAKTAILQHREQAVKTLEMYTLNLDSFDQELIDRTQLIFDAFSNPTKAIDMLEQTIDLTSYNDYNYIKQYKNYKD